MGRARNAKWAQRVNKAATKRNGYWPFHRQLSWAVKRWASYYGVERRY